MPFDVSRIEYVELSGYKSDAILQLKYLNDFLSLLVKKKPEVVYRCKSEGTSGDFIIHAAGVTYAFHTFGYKTIADLVKGNQLGFAGCNKRYKIYSGNVESDTKSALEEGDIYYYVMKLDYESLADFEEAFSKGFGNTDYQTYRDALSRGFKDYNDYSRAKEMQLDDDATIFYEARELHLNNKRDYDEYFRLSQIKEQYHFETFDQAHVFVILNRESLGRTKSLEDIYNTLQTEKPGRDSGVTPKWYTESFDGDHSQLEAFLSKNPSIGKIGAYYTEKQVFVNYSDAGLPPNEKSSILAWEYKKKDSRDERKSSGISLNWQLRD